MRFAKYGFAKEIFCATNRKIISSIVHKKYGNKIVLHFFFILSINFIFFEYKNNDDMRKYNGTAVQVKVPTNSLILETYTGTKKVCVPSAKFMPTSITVL
jgi:hypothetical protein